MKRFKYILLLSSLCLIFATNSNQDSFINSGSFMINMNASNLIYEITVSTDNASINDLERKRSHRRRKIIRKPTRGRGPK